MVNKTDYREVTVCRNDLYTVGLVTGSNDDRSNVQEYNTMFIWMFALIVAALKITYIVLHHLPMTNLKGIVD